MQAQSNLERKDVFNRNKVIYHDGKVRIVRFWMEVKEKDPETFPIAFC